MDFERSEDPQKSFRLTALVKHNCFLSFSFPLPTSFSKIVVLSVIQSEVSQKEKSKYHILIHIYGIQKNGTDEPICRAGIET